MKTRGAAELDILAAVRAMSRAGNAEEIVQTFSKAIEPLGVTGVFIGHIVDYEQVRHGNPMRIATWPTELMKARLENRAIIHDPIISYALQTSRPFRWSTAIQYANRYGRKIVDATSEYGLKDGVLFPIIGVESTRGAVSIGGEKLTLGDDDMMPISLLANHCYIELERSLGPFPFEIKSTLTSLETDVLHYAAKGKTAWETSQILHLTEDSVKASIKRARAKLGAVTTAHAVACAMRQNLLI